MTERQKKITKMTDKEEEGEDGGKNEENKRE